VADALGAPLDVIVVRKLGVPYQPELAMGAIGEDGVRVVDQRIVGLVGASSADIARVEERERIELSRRAERFRRGHARVPLSGRHVIVIDDGVATGSTARAACEVARAEGASRVTLAVPVAPSEWVERLGDVADELVAVETPAAFRAVGQFYVDFRATTDDEVVAVLARAAARRAGDRPEPRGRMDCEVDITLGTLHLPGHLTVPAGATGLVVFAHGSGSSRHSPRNEFVAEILHESGLGTLLFDLLTEDEASNRSHVFDVGLLAERLVGVTEWARLRSDALPIGYFGASTGAAAALRAAVVLGDDVAAVVSRGGRPDLTGRCLAAVRAPTLLIVGGADTTVLGLNRQAYEQIRCERRLCVVPGATHLFEEPGTLRIAAEAARDWFVRHLALVPNAG
jgi:predicted phosphoribosyltransferase/dienelactone hydrolase